MTRFVCMLLGRHRLATLLVGRSDGGVRPVTRCVTCGAGR